VAERVFVGPFAFGASNSERRNTAYSQGHICPVLASWVAKMVASATSKSRRGTFAVIHMSNDARLALGCCLLTALIGIGVLTWATTIEEQYQLVVVGAGLLAVLVGAVCAVGVMLALLGKG